MAWFYLLCCDGWRELYYVMRGTKNTGNMFHLGSRKGCRETWDEWAAREDVLELDASFPSLSHLPVQTPPPSGWTPAGFPSSLGCCATGLMSSTVHGRMFPYVSGRGPTRSRSWRTQEWRTSAWRQKEVERDTKNQADGIKSLLFWCLI